MKHRRKRARRNVKCTLCTDARWGNSKKMGMTHKTKAERKRITEGD